MRRRAWTMVPPPPVRCSAALTPLQPPSRPSADRRLERFLRQPWASTAGGIAVLRCRLSDLKDPSGILLSLRLNNDGSEVGSSWHAACYLFRPRAARRKDKWSPPRQFGVALLSLLSLRGSDRPARAVFLFLLRRARFHLCNGFSDLNCDGDATEAPEPLQGACAAGTGPATYWSRERRGAWTMVPPPPVRCCVALTPPHLRVRIRPAHRGPRCLWRSPGRTKPAGAC